VSGLDLGVPAGLTKHRKGHGSGDKLVSSPKKAGSCHIVSGLMAGGPSELTKHNFGTGTSLLTNLPNTGPNQGPVVFRAVPKGPGQGGNNTFKNVLVTYDFAMCRGGPGDDHAPEVFYEFKVRNDSSGDVKFNIELLIFSDLPLNQ
jgi:hypothetical protein